MVQSVSPALPHLTSVCSHGAIFLSCLELSSFGVLGACQDTWIYNAPHIIEIISYNSIVNPAHSGLFLKSSMKTQVFLWEYRGCCKDWLETFTIGGMTSHCHQPSVGKWQNYAMAWYYVIMLFAVILDWNQEWLPIGFYLSHFCSILRLYHTTLHHSRLNCQKSGCSTSAEGPERAAGRNDEDPVHRWQWGRA